MRLRQFPGGLSTAELTPHRWLDASQGTPSYLEMSDPGGATFQLPLMTVNTPTDLVDQYDQNGQGLFSLLDEITGEEVIGTTELSLWLPPPVPVSLNISTTRYFHDLWLHCVNGEEYPVHNGPTQGDLSWDGSSDTWWNDYGYFIATANYRENLGFWLIDKTTNEVCTGDATSWVSSDAPGSPNLAVGEGGGIALTWTQGSVPEGGNPISGYIIYRRTGNSGVWTMIGGANGLDWFYTDMDVQWGETYTYRVRAAQSLASGEASLTYFSLTLDTNVNSIPDWWEYQYFGGLRSYDDLRYNDGAYGGIADADGDGISDYDEYGFGTNPNDADTDHDGIPDDWEILHHLDPTFAGDATANWDYDGLSNLWEYRLGLDPSKADTDNNGILDGLEDTDYDGLTNLQEINVTHTDPAQRDTDEDGLNDGWELKYGMNPLVDNATLPNPAIQFEADPDGDRLTNAQEEQLGTNPFKSDTDDDGINDFDEDQGGSDPLNPSSTPAHPGGTSSTLAAAPADPPNPTVRVKVTFGDPSGSHSEKYRVSLEPLAGDPRTKERYRINQKYGQTQTETFILPKGAKYKVTLKWVGTSPRYRDKPRPDYDYTLNFESDSSANPVPYIKTDDPNGILGVHGESTPFFAKGKNATLYVPKFEWVTPKESPVTAPKDSGAGQNEFTYSDETAGVLSLTLQMKVLPAGAANLVKDDCAFVVPDITDSTKEWDPSSSPDGKPTVINDDLYAYVTFTNLPPNNSDFGKKTAKLNVLDNLETETDYEVFFPRDKTNHPDGQAGSLNWFHYWKDALSYSDIEYQSGSLGLYGQAPGMLGWSYASAPNKSIVYVYDLAATRDTGDPNSDHGAKETTGIDTFVDTVLHEKKHIAQIALADTMVTMTMGTPWQYGWSWQGSHNHWRVGPDGKPGVAGFDDDGDGTKDNLKSSGPGELGHGDDLRIDDGTAYQWPSALGAKPLPPWAGANPVEDQAYNTEPDDEHAQATLDWGNPGKQHKTINKYDD